MPDAPSRRIYGVDVTLILGMSKAEGIYMSADYRVTDVRSGKLLDDKSVKFLTVHYPPHQGGPKALLGYTGLATLPDRTPMGTWIRETLRGETEVIDRSMVHLKERLDRDVAPVRVPLIVNVLVTEPNNRRLVGGFSNLGKNAQGLVEIRGSFEYRMQELTEPFGFANGSGAARIVADQHLDFLRSQLSVMPRNPLDHMRLLATVNRRVAASESSVSPYCHVSFINADERTSPTAHVFVEHGEEVPFEMPVLLFGIDLTGMMRRFFEQSTAQFRGETPPDDLDPAAINEELKRRP